jgi:hypothetical protein
VVLLEIKKSVHMENKAKLSSGVLVFYMLLAFVFFAYVVYGAHVITDPDASFNIGESQTIMYTLNITVNNTDGHATINDTANITQVNVTLPPGIFFVNSTNFSSFSWGGGANLTFTYRNFTNSTDKGDNKTVSILSWTNQTMLLNGTTLHTLGLFPDSVGQFWFNVTANSSAIGTFTVMVDTLNGSGHTRQTNLTLIVNDTTTPAWINWTNPTNMTIGNMSIPSNKSYFIYNVTVIDNGPIDTITVTLINATNGTVWSAAAGTANYSNFTKNATSLFGNFSNLRNGDYYINVTVNDTGGNVNYTTWLRGGNPGAVENERIAFNISDVLNPSVVYRSDTYGDWVNSSSIFVNVTVVEANEANITFRLFNETTSLGNTTTSTTTTLRAINWSAAGLGLPDGNYTLNVTVGDYGPNVNQTLSRHVVIDTTKPSVTHACSPLQVKTGDTITCTCSASDVMTGVEVGPTFTKNPSTSNTGTFTTSCSATDYVGNTKQINIQYTVEQSGGGGSSSGGGGGSGNSGQQGDSGEDKGGSSEPSETNVEWEQSFNEDDSELESKGAVSRELAMKERMLLLVSGQSHHVGVVGIDGETATIEVGSEPQEVTLGIGESDMFEVTGDDYYDVEVTLVSITEEKAKVQVKYIHEQVSIFDDVGVSGLVWIIIIAVVVIAVVAYVLFRKK